jgi:alkylated DNA repair dioxygenase AlkB
MQQSLLEENKNLLPFGGQTYFYPKFFSQAESDIYFRHLLLEIEWKQQPIKMFGKEVMQPRLTAWYGDAGKSYTYSGITMQPRLWTGILTEIKQKIEVIAQVHFTSALLNLYRDGKDSMGWHRDNERELGINPVIGSVSFGVTRRFQLRNYADKKNIQSIDLTHGSFLLMSGETQHNWEHRVSKTDQLKDSRINITFRILI